MKFLFVDTYYSSFLNHFRTTNPGLINSSYDRQREELLSFCFGTADFYSYNLKTLGHKAEDIIVNDEILEKQWARENTIDVRNISIISKIQMLPFVHRILGRPQWLQKIALAQIKKSSPDILYIQDLSILNEETLEQAKNNCQLLVGQIACPLPPNNLLEKFDLIITSFPHYADYFRQKGINSEYLKLAFEERMLKKSGIQNKKYDVSFVGSFSHFHRFGSELLEDVSRQIPVHIWSQDLGITSSFSPLQKNFHGEVWGTDMYKILAQSKIVINRHISVAQDYANNMRLYEATGMGALLLTDEKKNINDIFEAGKEVVTYKNSKDLIDKIKYYLTHEKERQKIATTGQKRTLKDHSYRKRIKELVSIIKKYL